jgi:pilus assembly protein CpaF
MLQAMNTGHDGSLSTLHANSPRDALARIETMVLMGGMELPIRAIREQVASAVDLVVHLVRLHDGTRRISHLVEVNGMEGEVVTLTDLFVLDQNAGYDEEGKFAGRLEPTGLRPRFADRLLALGVLPAEMDVLGLDRRRNPGAPGLNGARASEDRRSAR